MPIEPGTVIGRYEIESLIAVGGMGEVYRARDHELHRSVALKFLSQEFISRPDRLNRFVQEARAASALNHPNIVTVYEIGKLEDRDNLPFIATELIDGVTLREYSKKPIKPPDGRYIVFISNRGGRWSIWRMNPDGANAIELARIDGEYPAPRVSPDSRWVFYSANAGSKQVVWKISIDGGTPTKINDLEMHSLALSPDGKLIAYYHRPPEFNAPLQVHIVSSETGATVKTLPILGDGTRLSWSPDGKALDYVETREGVSNLMRMPLEGGKPRQLTDWKNDLIFWFAWSPDGKQLACARGANVKDLILMEDLNLVQ